MTLMLPPFARILIAALFGAAILLARHIEVAACIYGLALFYVTRARCLPGHFRFVAVAGLPLLTALLFTWGFVIPVARGGIDADAWAGSLQAILLWLRILVLGAVSQWLLLPMVQEPLRLRAFVQDFGLPASVGILLSMPVLLLPDIRHQILQVADARRAQQLPTRGLGGVLALPATMVPVLAGLIETSLNRAELWEHRGLLEVRSAAPKIAWSPWWIALLSLVAPMATLLWAASA